MTFIQFATSAAHPLTDDDRLAVAALTSLGIRVEPVIWSRPPTTAVRPDAVVIRSVWDYYLRAREFESWITRLERAGVLLINSPALLRWNMHKNYLAELAARGVAVVPTVWVPPGDTRTLGDVISAGGWDEVVVKPAISASAYETWRVAAEDVPAHEARFAQLRSRGDVLVQKFVPEIAAAGEWSLIYFGTEFSHAVRKLPKSGDFRVQVEHGGSADVATPTARMLEEAARVMNALPEEPVYCRVDAVVINDTLTIMEVECIDPVLFLALAPRAAAMMADRVIRRVRKRKVEG